MKLRDKIKRRQRRQRRNLQRRQRRNRQRRQRQNAYAENTENAYAENAENAELNAATHAEVTEDQETVRPQWDWTFENNCRLDGGQVCPKRFIQNGNCLNK